MPNGLAASAVANLASLETNSFVGAIAASTPSFASFAPAGAIPEVENSNMNLFRYECAVDRCLFSSCGRAVFGVLICAVLAVGPRAASGDQAPPATVSPAVSTDKDSDAAQKPAETKKEDSDKPKEKDKDKDKSEAEHKDSSKPAIEDAKAEPAKTARQKKRRPPNRNPRKSQAKTPTRIRPRRKASLPQRSQPRPLIRARRIPQAMRRPRRRSIPRFDSLSSFSRTRCRRLPANRARSAI